MRLPIGSSSDRSVTAGGGCAGFGMRFRCARTMLIDEKSARAVIEVLTVKTDVLVGSMDTEVESSTQKSRRLVPITINTAE